MTARSRGILFHHTRHLVSSNQIFTLYRKGKGCQNEIFQNCNYLLLPYFFQQTNADRRLNNRSSPGNAFSSQSFPAEAFTTSQPFAILRVHNTQVNIGETVLTNQRDKIEGYMIWKQRPLTIKKDFILVIFIV